MINDYFLFVLKNLVSRKLRTVLTLIGIMIGITAIVSLVTLSQGMQNAIEEQFKIIGANRVIISPASSTGIRGGFVSSLSTIKLTKRDVETIRKVQGVEYAFGRTLRIYNAIFKNEQKQSYILGLPTDKETLSYIKKISNFEVEYGRQIEQGERKVAVLGYDVAHTLFKREIKTGDEIKIENNYFKVVGIQKKLGSEAFDKIIRIPEEDIREISNDLAKDEVSTIIAFVSENFEPDEVAESIEKALRKSRDVKEGQEDFTVQTAKQIVDTFKNVLLIIQILLIGVASISLLVGGVGIMNTMYTSVLERTRDIGVMKAVGAKNSDIFIIFLLESGLLGLTGGAIGVIFGLLIGKSAEIAAQQLLNSRILVISCPYYFIIATLIFSFLIGAISGVTPALQASRLKPADTLRYE
ncbi:MAG: ABC transporter permease [Candidatus Woesearchaeota archaeon]